MFHCRLVCTFERSRVAFDSYAAAGIPFHRATEARESASQAAVITSRDASGCIENNEVDRRIPSLWLNPRLLLPSLSFAKRRNRTNARHNHGQPAFVSLGKFPSNLTAGGASNKARPLDKFNHFRVNRSRSCTEFLGEMQSPAKDKTGLRGLSRAQ